MKLRSCAMKLLLALACLLGLSAVSRAQTLVWLGNICWQNVSSYDVVRVHWQPTNNSWWDSNMTVNGVTIGSVGNGSSYAGSIDVPGSGISLGWVRVGCGGPFGICAPYNPSIDYGQCNPIFEDSQIPPTEGYFWFEGARYASLTLAVSKSASSPYLAVAGSGQYYTITISVSNGPTTQVISVADNLPACFSTAGAITASGGSLYGCPGAGATNLNGCTIASGTYGPVTITVPVTIAATAASHNNYSISNTAYASGGGSSNCTGGCAGSTSSAVINALDDSDSKAPGVPSSTDVSANDAFPAGSSFTATGGSCANISPASPASNTTGILGYTVPGGSPACTVTYQLCAPAPYATVCDSATLTVTALASNPSITVSKALGGTGRIATGDQFTVQILQNGTVVNNTSNSTTAGSGTSVSAGSGSTGSFNATAGTSYAINEAGSNGAILQRYNSSVVCSRNGVTQAAFNLGGTLTPGGSDVYVCTITNSPRLATLTVRQAVLSPVPVTVVPPFSQLYTGTNGWTPQTVTNNALNVANSSLTETLAANNTATQLSTTLPDTHWFVDRFSCVDTSASISGNPTGALVTTTVPNIVIPAGNVLPGANLVCTMLLGHLTP